MKHINIKYNTSVYHMFIAINIYNNKKECALAHSRASRGRLRQSTASRECASLAR